jgi:hypothetical protein
VNFFDADGLAGENGAEVDFLVAEIDAPATGDDDSFVVEGIVDVGQSGIGAGGRLINFGRALETRLLPRTFCVPLHEERIAALRCKGEQLDCAPRVDPVIELRHEQRPTSITDHRVIGSSLGVGTLRNAGRRAGDRRRDAL